ncbi:hypothetical protein [Streptomyces sp. NPDC005525]|uniref:hypothetical protein n=1 Tax=Streptomyces sp. NPDC005525 TaxID=3364720 RepID=UPI00369CA451
MSGGEGKGLVLGPGPLTKVTQGLGATIDQLGEIGRQHWLGDAKGVLPARDDGHGGRGWADVESDASSP